MKGSKPAKINFVSTTKKKIMNVFSRCEYNQCEPKVANEIALNNGIRLIDQSAINKLHAAR